MSKIKIKTALSKLKSTQVTPATPKPIQSTTTQTESSPLKEAGAAYARLSKRTRLALSFGLLGIALGGIWLTDQLEQRFPAPKPDAPVILPSEKERLDIIKALEKS